MRLKRSVGSVERTIGFDGRRRLSSGGIRAIISSSYKMNLNEYMVTLEKPLGIRFALSADGNIFVHGLKKGVCGWSGVCC